MASFAINFTKVRLFDDGVLSIEGKTTGDAAAGPKNAVAYMTLAPDAQGFPGSEWVPVGDFAALSSWSVEVRPTPPYRSGDSVTCVGVMIRRDEGDPAAPVAPEVWSNVLLVGEMSDSEVPHGEPVPDREAAG